MMTRRSFSLALLVTAVAAAATGCARDPLVMTKTTAADVSTVPGFAVVIGYDGYTIDDKPLDAWLTTRTPEQKADFAEDQRKLSEELMKAVKDEAPGFQFTTGAPPPGYGKIACTILGPANASIAISDPGGQVFEEDTLKVGTVWGSLTLKMKFLGGTAGIAVAKHLKKRSGGG